MGGFFINRCEHCNVHVESGVSKCPLCSRRLASLEDQSAGSYPKYDSKGVRAAWAMSIFWTKILPCIVIGAFLMPSLIKAFTGRGHLLLSAETLGIAIAWIMVRYTFMSRMHLGKKFLLQMANVSVGLYLIDQLTGGLGWALNYVIPLMLTLSNLAMMVVVYKNKKLWNDYAVYLITLIVLGFLPGTLYLVKVNSLLWPSAIAAGFALMTIIAVYGFLDKSFKSYFHRRLHF